MAAMFEFLEGGIGLMPDPEDNRDGHVVPHHSAGVKLSFEIQNVGEHAGIARVGVEVDDQFVTEWTLEQIEPGESAAGFVSVGRLNEGTHTFLVYVNPGSGGDDHATSSIELP